MLRLLQIAGCKVNCSIAGCHVGRLLKVKLRLRLVLGVLLLIPRPALPGVPLRPQVGAEERVLPDRSVAVHARDVFFVVRELVPLSGIWGSSRSRERMLRGPSRRGTAGMSAGGRRCRLGPWSTCRWPATRRTRFAIHEASIWVDLDDILCEERRRLDRRWRPVISGVEKLQQRARQSQPFDIVRLVEDVIKLDPFSIPDIGNIVKVPENDMR